MQNRKGLVALLTIGAIILGLVSVFNYSSAIGPETIQFKDGKIGENYDAEYEPKISGALPAFGWSAEAPVLTYISSYGLNGALQFLTGTPSKNLPIRGTPKKSGTMQALVTFHYMGKSGWLPGAPVPKTKDYIVKINILDEKGSLPTPTPGESELAIDYSGLKSGAVGVDYAGSLKATNANLPIWNLGANNLSDYGLTAPTSTSGSEFRISGRPIKEGTATGTIVLKSRAGKNETDEISGDFKIEIKKGGGGGGVVTSPKINSFKFDNGKKSITVTEGDSITFKWDVSNATDIKIMGRLTPQSATDPAGQKNICEELAAEKCGLAGELEVNISRSSSFVLKATNTVADKSRTSSASVYVIVRPKPVPAKQYGTLLIEGKLDGKTYSGRIVPSASGNGWKLSKDNKEQEGLGVNSVPKAFNRAVGKFKLEFNLSDKNFTLFDPLGRKISAVLDGIVPSGDVSLGVNKTVKFIINFKSLKVTPTPTPTLTPTPTPTVTLTPTPTPGGTFNIKLGALKLFGKDKYGNKKVYTEIGKPTGVSSNETISYRIFLKCSGPQIGRGPSCSDSDYNSNVSTSAGQCKVAQHAELGGCKNLSATQAPFNGGKDIWTYYYPLDKTNTNDYYVVLEAIRDNTGAKIIVTKKITKSEHDKLALLDDSTVAESSDVEEVVVEEQVAEEVTPVSDEQETEAIAETPELALVVGTVMPNKSIITQTLDVMDSITLPIQFYTEKFVRDAIEVLRVTIYTNKNRGYGN